MTCHLIVLDDDYPWPFEQIKFDPSDPENSPMETYQYTSYAPESGDREHKRVRYVVRSEWLKAESKLSIEYRAEGQRHLPEGRSSAEEVYFWLGSPCSRHRTRHECRSAHGFGADRRRSPLIWPDCGESPKRAQRPLVLQKELVDLCRSHEISVEWDDPIRDLDRLLEATIEKDGKRVATRTPVSGQVGRVFQAASIALPPNWRERPA